MSFAAALKPKAKNLVVISDAGRDIDDEFAFVLLAASEKRGNTKLKAVIANLNPVLERAQLIKGTLNETGMGHVPVATGTKVNDQIKYTEFETMAAYKAKASTIHRNGGQLLKETFLKAPDKSITLVLISGMTDANIFLNENNLLARRKLERVVIMGGVKADAEGELQTCAEGNLIPDASYNNNIDRAAATLLYKNIQEMNLPATIVSRHAVYATAMPHKFFEQAGTTGSRVAKRLHTRHVQFMQGFWQIVNLPPEHPDRKDFPPRMTREWFINNFTNATAEITAQLDAGCEVAQHVNKVNLYDAITMLAVIENNNPALFTPVEHGKFSIIGLSEKHNGMADAAAVRKLLADYVMEGLAPSKSSPVIR